MKAIISEMSISRRSPFSTADRIPAIETSQPQEAKWPRTRCLNLVSYTPAEAEQGSWKQEKSHDR